jgi:acetyl-CoA acetyltransferase
MGLTGDAHIVGYAERRSERRFSGERRLTLEQWAGLAADALRDAGIHSREVGGLVVGADIFEAQQFVPATVAEYCGWSVDFAERVDLGGATPAGMVWRAASAIELGICEVVVMATASRPMPSSPVPRPFDDRLVYGASSSAWGSPQAEFELPYGNIAQNCGFAMYAQRYHDLYGWDEWARAKIASDQRTSACANPDAVFFGQPLTPDDVLASRVISEPLHLLEIVMPCTGGAALVMCSAERAKRTNHRPVAVTGFGERLTHKTPTYSPELPHTPVAAAAQSAFAMSGLGPADMDMVQLYDCYTITALLSIEDSGFCGKGEGQAFVREHDLSYKGDFPCNTHGGQLGFGQAGLAGGMSHVIEGVRQIQGRAGDRQLARHDTAYVTGTGGVMSEQAALVLQGA